MERTFAHIHNAMLAEFLFYTHIHFRQLDLGVNLVFNLVAKKFVVEIDGDGPLFNGKHLHGILHPVE